MRVVTPPDWSGLVNAASPRVFLGGSIEMNTAERWQDRVVADLSSYEGTILNPRRDDWDSTWAQDPTPGTPFSDQVDWELAAQQQFADLIVYYFDPNTKSPITLLELGMFGGTKNVVVCCPKTFWRYGNVAIVCQVFGIPLVHTLEEMVAEVEIFSQLR